MFAMILIGPSKFLELKDSSLFTFLGLCVMGFGCALLIIPILPEMIECIEAKYQHLDENELHNNISGLFIAFQGLGESMGPILGSVLESFIGFRNASDLMGCIVGSCMLLYFLFCGRFSMFYSTGTNIQSTSSVV
jgi:hypothetical protein